MRIVISINEHEKEQHAIYIYIYIFVYNIYINTYINMEKQNNTNNMVRLGRVLPAAVFS